MDKEQMKKEILKLMEQVEENSEGMKESLESSLQELKAKAKDSRRKANEYVVGNPERSVLYAAGFGLAIGLILTAMMKKSGHCRHCKD